MVGNDITLKYIDDDHILNKEIDDVDRGINKENDRRNSALKELDEKRTYYDKYRIKDSGCALIVYKAEDQRESCDYIPHDRTCVDILSDEGHLRCLKKFESGHIILL